MNYSWTVTTTDIMLMVMVLILFMDTRSTNGEAPVCQPLKYDAARVVKPRANCQKEEPSWASYTGRVNDCQPSGGFIIDYKCVSNGLQETLESCTIEVICPEGKFMNGSGHCNHIPSDCFYFKGDIVPKRQILGESTCSAADWEIMTPKFCSIVDPKPKCSASGRMERLNYVVDKSGQKRYVRSFSIEMAQTASKDIAIFMDKRFTAPENIVGTVTYCEALEPTNRHCHSDVSTPGKQYRILDRKYYVPIAHLGTCMTPVYGFGVEDVMVYDEQRKLKKDTCYKCKFVCTKNDIQLTISEVGTKFLRYCSRSSCNTIETTEQLITVPRDFNSKVSDERMVASAFDLGKTFYYNFESTCPRVEICEAMDCHFCVLRLMNVSCYSWYHYVLTLLILYLGLMIISIFIGLLTPIFKILITFTIMMGKVSLKILRMCMKGGSRKLANVSKFAEDGDIELETQPTAIYKQTIVRSTRSGISPIYVMIILLILPTIVFSRAPCSVSEVENVKNEVCTKIGDKLVCKQSSLMIIPLVSYDQTSCLHFTGPNDDIIGEIQITPIDLHFTCNKVHEFWTRNVEFISEHIVHCPHAADCSVEWCPKVNRETKVWGFSELSYPFEQFCKLGEACWGAGCFFCTDSCHVVRWFPKPRDPTIYEVFSCSKWDPAGVFHVEWQTAKASGSSTINLIHGQSKEIYPGVQLTLDFTVQTRYPILNKHFLATDDDISVVDGAPTGQSIPGTVGAIQCQSRNGASTMSDCVYAPNTCVCNPNQGTDSCDCVQVDIASVFSGSAKLPINVGQDYLEHSRGVVSLKTAAYGSAIIKIRSFQTLYASTDKPPECQVTISDFTGCHSCIAGCRAEYSCKTLEPSTIVLDCSNKKSLVLSCDNSDVKREVRASFGSPIIDGICRTPCSKADIPIGGVLISTGFTPLNNGSHVQLAPSESLLDWSNWLSGVWETIGWWKILWLCGCVMIIIITLSIMWRLWSAVVPKVKSL